MSKAKNFFFTKNVISQLLKK